MEIKTRKGMAAIMVVCMLLMMLSVNVFAAASNVSVGAQAGTITATRAAQSATFAVTTDADDAQAVTIAWFAADGITPAAAPAGLSATGTNVASGASTITINAGDTSVAGSYYFKATIDLITSALVTVAVTAPIQLTIADPALTLAKVYDGNATAAVTAGALIGVVGLDEVAVSAVATYDTVLAGIDKTITVVYSVYGADASKYIKPVNYTVVTGVITALQLTIANPALTLTKVYDGNTTAAVTAGALIGVVALDEVTVNAVATYDSVIVGTDKSITVVYSVYGADAANYIKPVNYIVTTGVISANNKTALTAAITAEVGAAHASPVYVLTVTDYTAASWTSYTDAIAAAIVVEADVNATQSAVDAAAALIATSKTGLVRAYILAIGAESTGGAGHSRTITISGANAGNLAGKYLVVQFTQGTGNNAKVSVIMISPESTNVTVSYQVAGTMVEAWLTSGMPNLVAPNMGVTVYATITTH